MNAEAKLISWGIGLIVAGLALICLLGACQPVAHAAPLPCPITYVWTQTQEAALADDLEKLPSSDPLWRMHDEWKALRKQAGSCATSQ